MIVLILEYNNTDIMPRMHGIPGSNPVGIWQFFRFVSLDIPYIKNNIVNNNCPYVSLLYNMFSGQGKNGKG